MIKTCKRCLLEKKISEFSNCTRDGEVKHTYCKVCRNAQVKISRKKNPIKYRGKETSWRNDNPVKRLLYCTRQSAKIKDLEHNIDETDFMLLPTHCPYLGIEIDYSAGNGKTMMKPSIDRVDPGKGYIKGNVELISSLANTMKSNASPEQLVAFAKEVLKRYEVPLY